MKYIIDIPEDIRVAISQMGLLRIPDEMIRVVDKAIQHSETQDPRKGYLSIDDVMSVFDDFMCGEVDEEGIETFWEMLKDKAESEET